CKTRRKRHVRAAIRQSGRRSRRGEEGQGKTGCSEIVPASCWLQRRFEGRRHPKRLSGVAVEEARFGDQTVGLQDAHPRTARTPNEKEQRRALDQAPHSRDRWQSSGP